MAKGLLITFEGIEGSGKSTQLERLAGYLREQGRIVLITREPGGTHLGGLIRNILLNPELVEMDDKTELLLYLAERAQHVTEVIKPALADGQIVLCDRFSDSTLAYQGYGRGLPLKRIIDIDSWATGDLTPNLTIFLDVGAREGLKRATKRKADRIERERLEFHQGVRKGYLKLAEKFAGRYAVIDASKSLELIHAEIIKAVEKIL